jgi:hypothetical protein
MQSILEKCATSKLALQAWMPPALPQRHQGHFDNLEQLDR